MWNTAIRSIKLRNIPILYIFMNSVLLFYFLQPLLADNELPHVLEGLRQNYGHLSGLSIRYTRDVITRSMALLGDQIQGDLATGHIHFKPPHFLRLDQESPEHEIMIADSKTLWWYIPDKKLAYQYPAQKFGRELEVLSDIFNGLRQLEERFVVSIAERSELGAFQVELRPDPPWEEIDYILLTVSKVFYIQTVDIHNQLGTITRFTLEGLEKVDGFDKDFFHFSVPKDVQIVVEGG